MKTLVIYKSKTGFTRQYAEWIGASLKADIREASTANAAALTAYDTLIYGGGLYAGGINGVKLITKNLELLKGKKIVVFATGASPCREEIINEVRNSNFTPKQQKQIRFFYLRGGFDYQKLPSFHKAIMSFMKWILKRKKNPTPDDQGMLAAFDQPVNFTEENNIKDLIAYVSSKN